MTTAAQGSVSGAGVGVKALALAALEALPNASAMVFDSELRYAVVRGQALREHGLRSQDLEGRLVADALGATRWAFYEPLYRAALRGETSSLETASPDGKAWYLVTVGPLRDRCGEIIGGVSFAADITIVKRKEQQFDALLDSAPDAIVVVDAAGQIVRVNAQAGHLFGYERDALIGQPVELLIPERFRGAHVVHRDGFVRTPQVRPMGGLDLVGRRRDGSEFPVEISLGPLDTAAGVLVSAAIRDITERQLVERAAAHLVAVVESSRDAIIGKDVDGKVTSWNPGAEALYGYSQAEMLGKSLSVLVPPGRDDELPEILRRVRSGERIDEFETVRARKDGSQVDVSLTVSPIQAPNGTVVGVSTIARDITDRMRYQEQLRSSAEHDSLTGVHNRRRFECDLSEQFGRARRYGETGALLILDINSFKRVNDLHGHPAGDRVLKVVAAELKGRLRATDGIARIGGDEFAILLLHVDRAQAEATAKDLRRVIREARIDAGDGTWVFLSASVGVALITAEAASQESVFAEADRAMYEEKRGS